MKTGYKIGDAMTFKPVFVDPNTTLIECSKLMSEKHVGSLIIKSNGKPQGIITEQDIVRKVVAKGKDFTQTTASDIMETKLYTVHPEDDIYDALMIMNDFNVRHLPVIHKENLVGFLTIKDILKIEPTLFDLVVSNFEIREEYRKPIDT
jgi:CBS domain-containing protein